MSVSTFFKGTFLKDAEYGPGEGGGQWLLSTAKLLTPNGEIDVDLTDTWYPDIKVGDLVECETGSGYFRNGRLVSYANELIIINGIVYKEPKR